MANIHTFQLDIKKSTPYRLRNLVTGDTANTFVIQLTDDDVKMSLSSTLNKLIAVFTRADGQVYTQDADTGVSFAEDGIVTIELLDTSYGTGENSLEIQVYERDDAEDEEYPHLVTTQPAFFSGRAARLRFGSDTMPSQMPMLEALIYAAREIIAQSPESATQAANAAAEAANEAAEAASGAASAANDAADAANAAAAASSAVTIPDGSVTTAKLDSKAVTTAKIDDAAVDTTQIKDSAVSTAKVAAKAITTAKIDDGAVDTTQIADGAVTSDKLAAAIVTALTKVGNMMKSLWTGNWKSGNITVPNITDYTIFIVKMANASNSITQGTNIIAMLGGTARDYFRGIGGYTYWSGATALEGMYYIAATRSGNVLTMAQGDCHSLIAGGRTDMKVTEIIGVI